MGRASRTSIVKRQRELARMERAAQKRAKRHGKPEETPHGRFPAPPLESSPPAPEKQDEAPAPAKPDRPNPFAPRLSQRS